VLLDAANAEVHSARADALLFQAARAQHVDEVIAPALERGDIVISDRYADSSVAYQGYGSEIPVDRIRELGAFSTRGIRPDLTILLDLPVRVGLARRASGDPDGITRFESEEAFDVGYHERVRAGYLELARAEPRRWRVVPADRDEAAIARDVRAIVEEFLDLAGTPAG
jgi:dTMP kinase